MSNPLVTYEAVGDVAVLRLDDGKANVFSPTMIQALQSALDRAEREAGAVALLGRDKRLSAGFDMSIMSGGVDAMRKLVLDGAELFLRLYEYPLPVVVGCTGHALAAGAILLLCADYRIGAEGEFKIGLNEVAIQMILPSFGVEVARDRLDKRHFTQAVTQARIYSPAGACDAGYLDETAAPEAVATRAIEQAQRLSALPRIAFHGTKLRERGATLTRIRSNLVDEITELTMG